MKTLTAEMATIVELTNELRSRCIVDCLKDLNSHACEWCAEDEGHRCVNCDAVITEEVCHKHEGYCLACRNIEDFYMKFGK